MHFYGLKISMGYMRISSAFDARMLVHFRLWRLKRRKPEENAIMAESSKFNIFETKLSYV